MNLDLLRRLNIVNASLLQGFALRESVQPSALNFELSAAAEKQWHGDFGAYGITLPLVHPIMNPFLLDIGSTLKLWSLRDSNP